MSRSLTPLEQIRQMIRMEEHPLNARLSRWIEKSKFSSLFPRFLSSRLSRWAFGNPLFDSNGRFTYRRLGQEHPIKFNGRNAQFHALYDVAYTDGYEFETAVLLLRLAGHAATFYDIGANWGYFSLLMAGSSSFKGKIYAFEPNPSTYADLKETIRQAGLEGCVTGLNYGLGTQDGDLTLLEPDVFKTGLARLSTTGSGQRVPVHKLDSLDLPPPDLIKLDAESMEKDILLGAQAVLQANRPHIIFENFLSFENPGETHGILELLADWGYRLFNPALLFQIDRVRVLASYGDPFSSLLKSDPDPQTALAEITTENRFLMRGQLNVLACHETRLNELTEAGCLRLESDSSPKRE